MGQTQALLQDAHRFGPAAPDEEHVYGSCAPSWHAAADHETCVREWVEDMQHAGIERVCSLLAESPDDAADSTLGLYADAFGPDRTLHASVPTGGIVDATLLEDEILPFLDEAKNNDEAVVVHGLSGLDRTGQVLAAWLTHDRRYRAERAVSTVHSVGRDPLGQSGDEAAPEAELFEVLQQVRSTPGEY
jgi:protein-tyrosine phosphatase